MVVFELDEKICLDLEWLAKGALPKNFSCTFSMGYEGGGGSNF